MMYAFLEPSPEWVGESDGQAALTAVVQTRRHHRPNTDLTAEFRVSFRTIAGTDSGATAGVDYDATSSLVEISGPWTWNETCQCSERRFQPQAQIYDDDQAEPVERFEAKIVTSDRRFIFEDSRGDRAVRINIIDDDGDGRSLTLEPHSREVVEGDPVTVKIRMDRPFLQTTQVQLKLSGDRDQVFESRETFSFTVSAGVLEETLEIPTRQNRLREPAADVTIRLHDPDRNNPEPYSVGEQGSLTFRITDDDPELTTPGAPRNVVATTGNRTMSIAWNPPTNQGGSPVTGYQYRRFYGDGTRDSWVSNGSQTSVRLTGLTNDELHMYQVRAVNAEGPGAASSDIASGTPSSDTTPTAPQRFRGVSYDQKVFLLWEPPVHNGGSEISRYEYRMDLGSWTSTGSADTSLTVTGLNNDQSYSFQLRAVNGSGTRGAESNAVRKIPKANRQPFTVRVAETPLAHYMEDFAIVLEFSAAVFTSLGQLKEYAIVTNGADGQDVESGARPGPPLQVHHQAQRHPARYAAAPSPRGGLLQVETRNHHLRKPGRSITPAARLRRHRRRAQGNKHLRRVRPGGNGRQPQFQHQPDGGFRRADLGQVDHVEQERQGVQGLRPEQRPGRLRARRDQQDRDRPPPGR